MVKRTAILQKMRQQDDMETEKTKEYQAKLDMIEPSAHRDASGLSLKKAPFAIIGKGTNDDFWVQVKKVPSRQVKISMSSLQGKKKAVKVVYSGSI